MKKTWVCAQKQQTKIKEELLKQLDNITLTNTTLKLSVDLEDLIKETTEEVIDPTIYITADAYIKMITLIQEYDTEVAAHFLVRNIDRQYIIRDVLIFPQTVTGITADGVDIDYQTWLHNIPEEQFKELRGHVHSHVEMDVTPSGVDEHYYTGLMSQVPDYYLTMVINKKQDYHIRLYDVTNNILYTELTFKILLSDDKTVSDWLADYKELIVKPTPKPTIHHARVAAQSYAYGNTYRQQSLYEEHDPWGYASDNVVTYILGNEKTNKIKPCASLTEAAEYIKDQLNTKVKTKTILKALKEKGFFGDWSVEVSYEYN